MLTVTVDRSEGVNIDQCEQVSRALDPSMLDEKEFDDMPSLYAVRFLGRYVAPPQASGAFPGVYGSDRRSRFTSR